jgi:hypothetical protein
MSSITINGLDDAIASIPAIFAFVPTESFIVLSLVGVTDGVQTLGTVARFDLTDVVAMPALAARQLSTALEDQRITRLIGVVTTAAQSADGDLPHRHAVETLGDCLPQEGFPLLETFFLPSFTTWARWTCYHDLGRTSDMARGLLRRARDALLPRHALKRKQPEYARSATKGSRQAFPPQAYVI